MTPQSPSPQTASSPAPVVVFDFDHTLYDGDSLGQLLRWLISRHVLRCIVALLATPLLAPLIYLLKTRLTAIRVYIWIATVRWRSVFDFQQAIDQFVSVQHSRLRGRLLTQGLECFSAHRLAGNRVVIATGAPVALARSLIALAGISDVTILGSDIKLRQWALCSLRHCHHHQKLAMLKEAGFYPITTAYSDSFADLPLLLAARRPVVVNPKETQITVWKQRLPPGTPIVNWGCPRRGGHRHGAG